jgi:hypothetical protein
MRGPALLIAISALRCTVTDSSPPLVISGVTTPFLQAADPASVRPSVPVCADTSQFGDPAPRFIVVGSGFQPRVVHSDGTWSVLGTKVVVTGPQTVELASAGYGTGVVAFLRPSNGSGALLPLGLYSVRVEGDDGQTAELKDAVKLLVPPQLTASPNGHCGGSDTVVTLTSDGFDAAAPPVVKLNNVVIAARVISTQQIEIRVPASGSDAGVQVDNIGCVRFIALRTLPC